MANLCPSCQAPIRAGAQFCSACRHPLSPAAGATQHIKPGTGPSLIIQEQGSAARQQPLIQFPVTIGREQAPGSVFVAHPTVSRQHARIEQRGAEYWLVDLGSTNGTSINGQRLPARGSHRLSDGDIFRIGDQQGNSVGITFRLGSQPLPTASTIHLGQLNLSQLPMFTVGRDHGNQVRLDHPTVSRVHAEVRRALAGHVLIDRSSNGTYVNGQRVAGQQAIRPGDVVQIGPFKLVYDQAGFSGYVTPAGNYRLDGRDLIREVPDGGRRLLGINIGGQPKTKRILNEVSLSIYPKEFVALVGGSGAGKSTLMKALSGFTPAKGQVLLNGDDLYRSFGAYRSILGYVPQDDIIHRQLTVRSALNYAAQLRLPDATPAELQKRIGDVLQQVEMTEHAAKPVHKLSGGQRKRVSIAVELLAEPGLFFLDEPTSGLDPGLEKKLMYTLRNLADAGRTIVLVTHATANIDQCDHVAFMADGYMAYFGPPKEALGFFGATDFADIYTRLSHPIDPVHNPPPPQCQSQPRLAAQPGQSAAEVWTRCYNASPQHQCYVEQRKQSAQRKPQTPAPVAPGSSRQRVSVLRQFGVLTRRYLELIRRDALSMVILLAVMPIIGMLLLIMTSQHDLTGLQPHEVQAQIQQDIDQARTAEDPALGDEQFQGSYQVVGSAQKLLFMLALAANLLGIFGAAYEIVKEEAIYLRERMVNLRIPPYLLSKMVVLGMFALIQCAMLLVVVALKVAYPGAGVFLPAVFEMYITLVLATMASISLGLLISALVRSQNMVIYVILLVLFVQIIFAGALFELPAAAKPISYLTTTRWTLEALGSTVDLEDLKRDGVTCLEPEDAQQRQMMGPGEAPCEDGQQKLAPPYEFNVVYLHDALHLLSRWVVLMAFSGVFFGLTYVVQRRKDVI